MTYSDYVIFVDESGWPLSYLQNERSPSRQMSRSTSAIRRVRGREAQTKTPMGCFGSTSHGRLTSRSTRSMIATASPNA